VTANAAIVYVDWSGIVSDSHWSVAGTIDIGDTITGSFSYDDATPPSPESFFYTSYYETYHDSSFSVNGLSGTTSGNRITVSNDTASGDQFASLATLGTEAYSGDLIGGQPVHAIDVRFGDSAGTALMDTSLPSELDSSDFDLPPWGSRIEIPIYDFLEDEWVWTSAVKFDVTDFTTTTVPIPAAVWLFGSALAGLGWLRRKQTAQVHLNELS